MEKITIKSDSLSVPRAEQLRKILNDFFLNDFVSFYDGSRKEFIFATDEICRNPDPEVTRKEIEGMMSVYIDAKRVRYPRHQTPEFFSLEKKED